MNTTLRPTPKECVTENTFHLGNALGTGTLDAAAGGSHAVTIIMDKVVYQLCVGHRWLSKLRCCSHDVLDQLHGFTPLRCGFGTENGRRPYVWKFVS